MRECLERAGRAAALACLSSALILAGPGCGDDDPSEPRDRGVGQARIGLDGGTVRTDDDNARLVVPAGALSASTLIGIHRLPLDSLPPPLLARRRVSETYRYTPEGLAFGKPVEVQIFFDADLLPAGVELEDLTVGKVNAAGEIEELSNIRILEGEQANGIRLQATRAGVGGQVSAFSPFAVWVKDPERAAIVVVTSRPGSRGSAPSR